MFGYEEELQNQITALKLENEKLQLSITNSKETTSERFFFFVFSYWSNKTEGKGNLCIKSRFFPKQEDIKAKAIKQVSEKHDEPMWGISLVIESFIEMSEDDYTAWLS